MFLLAMFDLLLFRILNGLRKRSPAHKPLQALRIRDVFNLCSFHSVRIGPFKRGGGRGKRKGGAHVLYVSKSRNNASRKIG